MSLHDVLQLLTRVVHIITDESSIIVDGHL